MKLLFVHPSVSDLQLLKISVLDDVFLHQTREIVSNDILYNIENISHISFMFHTSVTFPFHIVDQEISNDTYGNLFFHSFVHFLKRIKERKKECNNNPTNQKLYIDFLSCNFNPKHIIRLLGKRNVIQYLDNVVLRVSTNDTGNKPFADWVMEYSTDFKKNVNIQNTYFNSNITDWNVILDSNDKKLIVNSYNNLINSHINLTQYTSVYFETSTDASLNALGDNLFESRQDRMIKIVNIYHKSSFNKNNLGFYPGFYPGLYTINIGCFKNCISLNQPDLFRFANGLERIYNEAFYGCTSLTDIDLSNTKITELGISVFESCTSLESVTLSGKTKTIGKSQFKDCTLLKHIYFPDNITEDLSVIPEHFAYNTLLETFVIPDTINYIGSSAFSNISTLNEIIFEDSNIGIVFSNFCFSETNSLKSFTFPNRPYIQLQSNVFESSGLEKIEITKNITILEDKVFLKCKSLTLCTFQNYSTGEIKTIKNNCFNGCISLEEFHIPQYVKTIQDDVFSGCRSLEVFTFMNSPTIETLGNSTFENCTSLRVITLPKSVKTLGNKLFQGCTSLKEIYLKDTNISIIPESCFSGCSSLSTIELNDGCHTINNTAFENCTNLYSITFGSGIKKINKNSFIGCNKLVTILVNGDKNITKQSSFSIDNTNLTVVKLTSNWIYTTELFEENIDLTNYIPENITNNHRNNIHEIIFGNGLKDGVSIPQSRFINYSSIHTVTLPNMITNIPEKCFMNSSIYQINIPNNVTSIGIDAFSGCKNLQFVNIDIDESQLTTIGSGSFKDTNIEIIELPNSLKTIEANAFYNCPFLKHVLLPKDIQTIGESAFILCNPKCVYIFNLYEYEETIDLYNLKITDNIFTIHEDTTTYNNNPRFFYAKQILYSSSSIDNANKELIYDISFDNLITTIDNIASNTKIKNIVIPSSVENIKKDAFLNCKNLQFVEIGSNVKLIESDAFRLNHPDCKYIIDNYSNYVVYADNTFTNTNIYFKKKYFVHQYQLDNHANNYEEENLYLTEFTITDDKTKYNSIVIFPDRAEKIDGSSIINFSINGININIDSFTEYIVTGSISDDVINNHGISINGNTILYEKKNIYVKHNTTDISKNEFLDAIRCDLTIKIDTKIFKDLHIGYNQNVDLNSITNIPRNCFKNAINLESVRIPKYENIIIDDFRTGSFFGCTNLTTFIRDKPWNQEDVNDKTVNSYFSGPTQPVNHIYFSELKFSSNREIKDYIQFSNYTENNKYVQQLTLMDSSGLTHLYSNLFENLPLKSVIIPNNITTIETNVFKNSDVRTVNVEKTTKEWNTVNGVKNIIEESLHENYIVIIKEQIYPIEIYKNSYLPYTLHNNFIENNLYEEYSDIAYPLLKSFKTVTWQQNGYTNVIKTPNIIKILNGLFFTFYQHIFEVNEETRTVSLLDHINLSTNTTTNTNIDNTFIYVPRNWTFNGNGYYIDITGIYGWNGLFTCSKENPHNEYVFIKNIGVLGGATKENCGFILQSNMNYVSIHNTFSTGTISLNSGGIIGNNCNDIKVYESFSTGEIKSYSGGIVGYDTSNNVQIRFCYSSGNINENGCGILALTSTQITNIELQYCYSSGELVTSNSYGIYHSNNASNNFLSQRCYSKIGVFELYNNIFNIDFYIYARNTNFDMSYNKFEQKSDLKYPILTSFRKFPYDTTYIEHPISFYDKYLFGVFKVFHNDFYFDINNKVIYLDNSIVIDGSIYTKDSYIYLQDGWKFQGNGNKIHIDGIDNWTGLIRCSKTFNHIIENVAIINGKTDKYCGYILHKEQENVTIYRCYVEYGVIGEYGGGLVGAYSGTFGNFINIYQCYFNGVIGEYGGGLVGAYSGTRGSIKIENSYVIIEPGGISSFSGGVIGSHSSHYGNLSFKTMYVLLKNLTKLPEDEKNFDHFSYAGTFSDSFRINYKNCFINKTFGNGLTNIDDINITSTNIDGIKTIFDELVFDVIYDDTLTNTYTEDNYPKLKCFNQLPWNKDIEFHGLFNVYNPIYNKQDDWFVIVEDGSKKEILLNQFITISDYIDYDTYTYKDSYITLSSGYTFNGNNKSIDLSGIDSWKGLIKSNATSSDSCVVKDIGFFNGKTYRGAGYILQSYQNNVKIESCFSYGEINDYCGGIIGEFCGVVFNEYTHEIDNEKQSYIIINNSYSNGDIYNHSGGITGPYCCQGNCNMHINNCFTTGNVIGIHASGILGKFCGNNKGNVEIKGCITYGSISGYNASGIIGYNVANNHGTCNIEYSYSTSRLNNELPKFIVSPPFNAMFEGVFNLHHFYFVDNSLNNYDNVSFFGDYLGEYDGSYDISKTLFLYNNSDIEPDNYIPEFSSFSLDTPTSNGLYGISFLKHTDISSINHVLDAKSNNIDKQHSPTKKIYFKQDELNNIGLPLVNTFTMLPWSSLDYHHYDTMPVFSVFKDLWINAYGNSTEIKNINIPNLLNDVNNSLYKKIIETIRSVTDPNLNEPLIVIKQMYDELFNIHFSNNVIIQGNTYQKIQIINEDLEINLNIGVNIKNINVFNSFYFYNKDNNCFIVDFETILDGNNVNDNNINVPLFYTYIQRGYSLKVRNKLDHRDVFMISIERDMNGTDYIIKYLTNLNRVDEYTILNTDISQTHILYIKINDSSLYHFNIYFKPIFMIEYIGIKTLNYLNLFDSTV